MSKNYLQESSKDDYDYLCKAKLELISAVDTKLSDRFIHLDKKGYFIIKIDEISKMIVVEHYENDINKSGVAVDKETGQPIECTDKKPRTPKRIYRGRSAKEVGIELTEGEKPYPLEKLDHALYLGRELQKAEACMIHGKTYIQD